MDKKKLSYYLLPLFFFFILFVLVINWTEVSWIFDWRVAQRIIEDSVKPNDEKISREAVGELDHLVILSLNIEAPLRSPVNSDLQTITEELDRGVVLYPDSARLGEVGKAVILGHSAPAGYPDIKFDRVFSNLGDLKNGDLISVYYNEELFVYSVLGVVTMSIEEYNDFLHKSSDERLLIVSTCYPPGSNWQRWVATSSLLTE
jgi:LPXTG-site transpeptidase (sortase) family protein